MIRWAALLAAFLVLGGYSYTTQLVGAEDKSTNIWVYEGKVGVGPPLLVEGGPKAEMGWPGEISEKEWEEIILGRLQQLHIGPDGRPGKPQSFDSAKVSDQWTVWNLQRDRL
jgi:hypothetical protein